MSGIAAWFDRKAPHENVPPGIARCFTDQLARRIPGDYQSHSVEGAIFAGAVGSFTSCAQLAVLWDGYREHPHDVRFVLEQWRRLGPGALQLLEGDWALIVWELSSRTIFCARSAFGLRPLYMHAGTEQFACASDVRALTGLPGVTSDIDEAIAAEHLSGGVQSRAGTLYREIQKVEPGCYVRADANGVSHGRAWDLQADESMAQRGMAAAASELRGLIKFAVRLRLAPGAAVELSGGIDSSIIASQAALLTPHVSAYSLVYPGLACDESSYIADVVKHAGLRSHLCAPTRSIAIDWAKQARNTGWPPLAPNVFVSNGLRRAATAHPVLLTGQGGDVFFTGSALHYADLARANRFGRMAQLAVQDRIAAGSWTNFASTLRRGFSPLVPLQFKRGAREPRRFPAWLNPDLARRTSLADRLDDSETPGKHLTSLVQREIYRAAHSGQALHLVEENERAAASAGIEYRHPFFDPSVAQFGFALPDSLRREGLKTKLVLRKAFGPDLPPSVRHRTTKAEFRHLFFDAFDNFGELPDNAQVVQRGWVDAFVFNRALRERATVPIWAAWSVLALEAWLQSRK